MIVTRGCVWFSIDEGEPQYDVVKTWLINNADKVVNWEYRLFNKPYPYESIYACVLEDVYDKELIELL